MVENIEKKELKLTVNDIAWVREIIPVGSHGSKKDDGISLTVAHNYFDDIAKVEFFPPATKVTFKCGAVMTATAHEGDEFNEEVGIMICVLKYMCLCSLGKNVNTYLHREIKKVRERGEEEQRKLKEEQERKEIKARQKAKKERYKAKKAAAKRQQEIEIQKEAYLQAMKEMDARK